MCGTEKRQKREAEICVKKVHVNCGASRSTRRLFRRQSTLKILQKCTQGE